jgi:hypothetical protein
MKIGQWWKNFIHYGFNVNNDEISFIHLMKLEWWCMKKKKFHPIVLKLTSLKSLLFIFMSCLLSSPNIWTFVLEMIFWFYFIVFFSTSYILFLLCFEFAHEKFLKWKHSQVIHLNYHNCDFIRLQFNIKCEVIFNIKIIKILIIHVVIDLSENHIRIYIWYLRK